MPSIESEVYCECGNSLNCKEIRGGIEVEPCEKCLENAKEEGYNEGYNEGYDERDKEEV